MSIWVADDAVIYGNVILGEDCSVYYHSVIRAESGEFIIGRGSNIQDNCVVHGGSGTPVLIGEGVTIGHSCIIHGCTIGDNTLIGMGSIIMNRARIGNNVIIGAGSLVMEDTVIPDNSVAYGRPARVIRSITEDEIEENRQAAEHYIRLKDQRLMNEPEPVRISTG